ncbi:MAG: hypothetical protein WA804_12865, partial [Terriglobales bacterium]
MVDQPEFRDDVLVWRRGGICPERSRRARSVRFMLVVLLVLAHSAGWAQDSPPVPQQPAESPSQSEAAAEAKFGTITPYLGLPIDQIELPGVPPDEAASL